MLDLFAPEEERGGEERRGAEDIKSGLLEF